MANILVGVSGGIAAYKMVEVVNQLVKDGHQVQVIMTQNAQHFVGTMTFHTLTGRPVGTDLMIQDEGSTTKHVDWGKWADLYVIGPATANVIGKLANGIADDFLTTTFVAMVGRTIVFPAMNSTMYQNTFVQANIKRLQEAGVLVSDTDNGRLACGDIGSGKLLAVDQIIARIRKELTN